MKSQVGLNIVVQILVLFTLCGCNSMRTLLKVQNVEGPGPYQNEVVKNSARDGFKVFQILDDGRVLATHPGFQYYKINPQTGVRADTHSESFLDLRVKPLTNDYVDEQALKTGYYRYIGVFEYTTKRDKVRKIRDYEEVPAGTR